MKYSNIREHHTEFIIRPPLTEYIYLLTELVVHSHIFLHLCASSHFRKITKRNASEKQKGPLKS